MKNNSIPSTLEECNIAFDAILSEEQKNDIANAGNGDLFRSEGLPDNRWNELIAQGFDPVALDLSSTHFGLGLWIRNKWIYPSPYSNIAYKFIAMGIRHPDDMSSMIVTGYYMYLNDIPYRITIQPRAIAAYAIVALIFTSSLVFIIIGKHRK